MKKKVWSLGDDQIGAELRRAGRRVVMTLNGQEIARSGVKALDGWCVALRDGRSLDVKVEHDFVKGYDVLLIHNGRYVPDDEEVAAHRCVSCGAQLGPFEGLCSQCGAEVDPLRLQRLRAVSVAATLLRLVAAVTVTVGLLLFAAAAEIEAYTSALLTVAVGFLLAMISFGVKSAPLPALVAATAVYSIFPIWNVIAGQPLRGALIHVIVFATLAKAIAAAREPRIQ